MIGKTGPRAPLVAEDLRRRLLVPGGLWTELRVVAETGSTNADLVGQARAGTPEGAVLVAERQLAGRGRMGRRWESPPGAGLTVSVLLRPATRVPANRLGWLPLLTGVALVEAVREVSEVDAVLKWPNDLLIEERKCAGILAEHVNGAVVVGVGLNTDLRTEELPRPDATSLALAGATDVDRGRLLVALLESLSSWYRRWCAAAGDPLVSGLAAAYSSRCATLDRHIRAELPSGAVLTGRAEGIDGDGRLLLGDRPLAAADVVHIRN